jgi:tetratricopeptide (TPR) repeat protein
MLNLEPEFRPHLKALVLALKGETPEAAFSKAYGKRIDEVEAALRDYFHKTTIRAELFNIQLPKSIDTPEVETGAAMPARIALAELLGNTRGQSEAARSAWELLAKEFPQSWEVESGWGEFAWRQRKLDVSAKHFARAVELGCKDEPDLLLYARVLGYDRRDKEAAAVLLNAARLYPESNELNLELGATLVRTANYGAALGALLSVKKVATAEQAFRLYYNLAYSQYRLADAPHARESIAKARTFTKSAGEIASLDRLQQSVDRPAPSRTPAPGVQDSEDAPRLVRRAQQPDDVRQESPAAPNFPFAEGSLEVMECDTLARLHVRIDGVIKIFVIPDPTKVSNGGGTPVDIQCGPQKPPRPLRLEYQALPSLPGVTGLVRTLELK